MPRIHNQNRFSFASDTFHKGCTPGQTAQIFIASGWAGEDVAVQMAAVNYDQIGYLGMDIRNRK